MRLATTLALVLTPLLVIADSVWHFETQSGRADGSGTKRCQKFYMKKQEPYSFKMDKRTKNRSMRLKRFPAPQQNNGGDWGNYPQNPNGAPNPDPFNPLNPNSWGQPPSGGNGQQPPKPNDNNKPQQPNKPSNGGQWNGPKGPGKPQEFPKCCLKMYTDDDCKDMDSEVCVEDKSDDRRLVKGKAVREFRGFNIFCTEPHW